MKKRILSILLATVMVLSLGLSILNVNAEESEEALPFTDVKSGSWFRPYVERVYTEGVMEGKSETLFAPNEDMTRAQLVTILYRLAGATETGLGESLTFTDTKATAWYADYVGWAVKEGLVTGYPEGTFAPNKAVSRQEIAKLFVEFIEYLGVNATADTTLIDSFADAANFPAWSAEYIENMRLTGLIGGDSDGNFNPKKSATRAEVATILTRYLDIPKKSVSPDGTELHYFGELEEDAFNEWIMEITAEGTQFTLASTEDFAGIVSAYEALGQSDYLRRNIKVTFTDDDGKTEERTYLLIMQEPTVEDDDLTAENIGVEYEDPTTGIKFSYLRVIGDDNGPIYTCGTGIHGGHHTRVVRTDNGTYAIYALTDTGAATEEHPLWWQGVATYGIMKLTSKGAKLIHTLELPQRDSTHVPNIFAGKNGYIYIPATIDDPEKYMESLEIVKETGNEQLLEGGAWLEMYVLDTNTDTVELKGSVRPDFETHPLEDRGYGKPQAVVDNEYGKIYALFNGGTVPGYIAWFIYDIESGEWDEECHTIYLSSRRDYFNAYPDGKGGLVFFVQRNCSIEAISEAEGIEFTVETGFTWDGLYIYSIPDPTKDEFVEIPVKLAEYSKTEVNKPQTITHYGIGGCTYKDFDGNYHVLYTHTKDGKMTTYHAVYDSELNEIKNEPIKFTEENGGRKNTYSFAMTQGPSGTYYILAMSEYGLVDASFEVWSSEDGLNYTCAVKRHELKTEAGETVPPGKVIISNSRCHSVMDGVATVIFNSTVNNQLCYYNVVLTLP